MDYEHSGAVTRVHTTGRWGTYMPINQLISIQFVSIEPNRTTPGPCIEYVARIVTASTFVGNFYVRQRKILLYFHIVNDILDTVYMYAYSRHRTIVTHMVSVDRARHLRTHVAARDEHNVFSFVRHIKWTGCVFCIALFI